jgi:hypothetical protein
MLIRQEILIQKKYLEDQGQTCEKSSLRCQSNNHSHYGGPVVATTNDRAARHAGGNGSSFYNEQ